MLPEETAKNASLLLERCIFGEIYCQNADTGDREEWKQKSIRKSRHGKVSQVSCVRKAIS